MYGLDKKRWAVHEKDYAKARVNERVRAYLHHIDSLLPNGYIWLKDIEKPEE